MAHFQKLPVNIDAVKWNGATLSLTNGLSGDEARLDIPGWLPKANVISEEDVGPDTQYPDELDVNDVVRLGDYLFIGTTSGTQRVAPGDWILRGVEGEIYPCTDSVFMRTYTRI